MKSVEIEVFLVSTEAREGKKRQTDRQTEREREREGEREGERNG